MRALPASALLLAALAGCLDGPGESTHALPVRLPPAPGIADPLMSLQWPLQMVRLPDAWAYATGRNVTIAIIDGGFDVDHVDLVDKMVLMEDAAFAGAGLEDADAALNWHGTGTAGIAAASTRNGVGIAGAAPDARILPVRAFTTGGPEEVVAPGFDERIAAAIRFAADNGAQVVSMSFNMGAWGEADRFPATSHAIDHAWEQGVLLVAAAGNDYSMPMCARPAAHPRVLCVGSVGPTGTRATYSSFDATQTHVVAPGGETGGDNECRAQVLTTQPIDQGAGFCSIEDGEGWYAYNAGTSYATPLVAGIAALLAEQGLTNEQALERIKGTAHPWTPLGVLTQGAPDPLHGHGLVDALCAVTAGSAPNC